MPGEQGATILVSRAGEPIRWRAPDAARRAFRAHPVLSTKRSRNQDGELPL